MPSSKEEAEQEYMRARMAAATLSDPPSAPSSSSPTPSPTPSPIATATAPADLPPDAPPAEVAALDDTISAARAAELKEEGNALYKAGEYVAALDKYSAAASSAHAPADARAIALANRAAANLKLQRFRDTADDASAALALRPAYVKALRRRKEARLALAEWRPAIDDARQLKESHIEIQRLTAIAEQKEAKDRDEAIESLKGLGNSILSNFGMSLDDINMQKDPNTGSYSINMKK